MKNHKKLYEYEILGKKIAKYICPIDDIQPNDWNPNEMTSEQIRALRKSIKEVGFTDEIKVREKEDGTLEIVDGEQRWRELKAIGAKEVSYVHLGRMSDIDAKRYTIIFNETHGRMNPVELVELVDEVVLDAELHNIKIDDLGLPWSEEYIIDMIGNFIRDSELVSFDDIEGRLDQYRVDERVSLTLRLTDDVMNLWYKVKNKIGVIIEQKYTPKTDEEYDARVFEFVVAEGMNLI